MFVLVVSSWDLIFRGNMVGGGEGRGNEDCGWNGRVGVVQVQLREGGGRRV